MVCTLCGQRKARRACPAVGREICAICCGSKRLVEIRCPSDCGYLASAREHPAAMVRRQTERDLSVLGPVLGDLTQVQHELFLLFLALIARHQPDGFQRLRDSDVIDAAGALATSLETAARGVIYDQRPTTLPAQRLWTELKAFVADVTRQGGSRAEHDVALVLRRLERAAREAGREEPGGDSVFLALAGRIVRQVASDGGQTEHPVKAAPPSLIIP